MSDLKPVTMYCCKGCQHLHHEIVTACDCGTGCEPFEYEIWEARRTQPEATAPAPIPGLPFADLATPIKEFEARKAAALASSANALVAGDRVDAETPASIVSNHEFMRALEAYTDTFPRAGKEALIDLRRTSDYGLVAAIDAAILQSQKAK